MPSDSFIILTKLIYIVQNMTDKCEHDYLYQYVKMSIWFIRAIFRKDPLFPTVKIRRKYFFRQVSFHCEIYAIDFHCVYDNDRIVVTHNVWKSYQVDDLSYYNIYIYYPFHSPQKENRNILFIVKILDPKIKVGCYNLI